jgi:anthranilate synthase/aminodeoxychorismate synthase-like glutamine amidotransferase
MQLLLIDNNDSFTFNIVNILREIDGCNFRVINYDELKISDPDVFSHFVISPGPMKPEDFPKLNQVIDHSGQNQKPLLGICLGHQTICTHFGGKLYRLDNVIHGQQRNIEIIKDSAIFNGLPKTIDAGLYHSWTVSPNEFPNELEITAQSGKYIMAVQHKRLPIFGIQFHPESFLTAFGKEILTNFTALR